MKKLILPALALAVAAPAQGQMAKDEVLGVIEQIFNGMREGDSAKVRSHLHPTARLGRAAYGPNARAYSPDSPDGWLRSIGTPHPAHVYNEVIWNPVIQVKGTLATAWTPYAFFFGPEGTTYRHCGVNTFQLIKEEGRWLVASLVDIETPEDMCDIPASVRASGRPYITR